MRWMRLGTQGCRVYVMLTIWPPSTLDAWLLDQFYSFWKHNFTIKEGNGVTSEASLLNMRLVGRVSRALRLRPVFRPISMKRPNAVICLQHLCEIIGDTYAELKMILSTRPPVRSFNRIIRFELSWGMMFLAGRLNAAATLAASSTERTAT